MSAEGLLASPFAVLPDLIRAHAADQPDPSGPHRGRCDPPLYGALAALMDGIAAVLQRDSVSSGEAAAICARTSINYAAAFCCILAVGSVRRISPDPI